MIISVHIPKTGGRTFGNFLATVFDGCVVEVYANKMRWMKTNEILTEIPEETRCIHGHGALRFLKQYPDAQMITWLRDPVNRIVSMYAHHRRVFQDERNKNYYRHPAFLALKNANGNMTLKEYAELPVTINEATKTLIGCASDLNNFAFLGITAYYETAIKLFSKVFKIREIKACNNNINPGKKIGTNYNVSKKLKKKILALNKEDFELYKKGREIFFVRCRNFLL